MATSDSTALDAARRLAPELSERAAEAEKLRTIPTDLVDKLRAAKLFRLGLPAALGGLECDPVTIVETMEEIARADGSAGWITFIGSTNFSLAWLEQTVAKEMVAKRPDSIVAAGFAPTATARLDGDDLVVNGRWNFSSGAPHADWFMNGVLVMEGDALRMLPSGRPDWRFVFMPADQVKIVDTWHVAGLEGTGSHDVVADSVRVPSERTLNPYFEPAVLDGPLYRLPYTSLLSVFMSAWPLGVARRALDEFAVLANKKSRSLIPGPVLAEDAAIEVEVARAEAMVRSARAFFLETFGAMWDSVCAGDELSMPQRTASYLAALNTAQASRAAVESVFGMAGAGAVFDSSPLQRCARDIMVGTQHIVWALGRWKTAGRVLLGLDHALDHTFPAPAPRS